MFGYLFVWRHGTSIGTLDALQCVASAMCGSVFSVLQYVAVRGSAYASLSKVLLCVYRAGEPCVCAAVSCIVLQCAAVCCSVLQCVAGCCTTDDPCECRFGVHIDVCVVLQGVAVCCSVSQSALVYPDLVYLTMYVMCCSVLLCDAVCQ